MQIYIISEGRYFPDLLHAVVMDPISFCPTAWADMLLPRKLFLYMLFLSLAPYYFTITSSNPSSFAVLSS